jgi:hypothetical protein
MSDSLEDWVEIRDQRLIDIELEIKRDEDPQLIKILKDCLERAEIKIEELTNV